jgi:hypothetical protein
MRRNTIGSLMSVAALSLGVAGLASIGGEAEPERAPADPKPRKKPRAHRPSGPFRSSPIAIGSIAQGNRHGGAHQHSREIQRRLRQTARKARAESGG